MAVSLVCLILISLAESISAINYEDLYGKESTRGFVPGYERKRVSGSSAPPSSTGIGAATTLREAAAKHGLFIGTAINYGCYTNQSEPLYRSTFTSQYNLATAENECKTGGTEATRGQFTLSECEFLLNVTASAGGKFRGHNTVWGVDNPAWEQELNGSSSSVIEAGMIEHIDGVLSYFAGNPNIVCWDVVNEPFSDAGGPSVIFKPATPWYPGVPTYVEDALVAASKVEGGGGGKGTLLFVNEYGAEAADSQKAAKVYATMADYVKRGVPVTGVGLQMHIHVDSYPNPIEVAANIKSLGELGLKVHITEMDVACPPPCDLQKQADIYGAMLQACLNNTGVCESFETWGFTDRYTWLWSFNNPTHENMQPLPFDTNYGTKPAFDELLAVLNA